MRGLAYQETKWPDGSLWLPSSLTQAAIIARVFASWTRSVEVDLADTTDVVLGYIPSPGCDGVPFLDCDFHDDR